MIQSALASRELSIAQLAQAAHDTGCLGRRDRSTEMTGGRLTEACLQEGHVIHDLPFAEALRVAQVAQIVAVAPNLIGQLRVAHRRAVHILVDCVVVLRQLLGQVPNVV